MIDLSMKTAHCCKILQNLTKYIERNPISNNCNKIKQTFIQRFVDEQRVFRIVFALLLGGLQNFGEI